MKLVLRRTHQKFIDKSTNVEGVRMTLTITDDTDTVVAQYPCIERGGNFWRVPPGLYQVVMQYWLPKTDLTRKVPALRFQNTKGPGGHYAYIHPGNFPTDLQGCVAPGMDQNERGVTMSRVACKKIFETLRPLGWELGETFPLVLLGPE